MAKSTSVLENPPFEKLNELVSNCTTLELAWLSGYLWALSRDESKGRVSGADANPSAPFEITLISASQTGNARSVANELVQDIERLGLRARNVHAADYSVKQIAQASLLILVTSTQGEGEPPEEALAFYQFLGSKKAPRLDRLRYAVLGLGDSSYVNFCQAAIAFDRRLAQLGADRLLDTAMVDIDFQTAAGEWRQRLIEKLASTCLGDKGASSHAPRLTVGNQQYAKLSPFRAVVNVNQRISGRDSKSDVRHIELDLTGSGIHYRPGDALGVWFKNDAALVNELLGYLGLAPDDAVDVNGQAMSLIDALTEKYELTQNTANIVKRYAKLSQQPELLALVDTPDALRDFSIKTPIVDMVRRFPARSSAAAFIGILRPITPRLYSISSCQDDVGEEVHITVAAVSYFIEGKRRFGGASEYLSAQAAEEGHVDIFIEPNDRFRLPEDNSRSVIMIGAGTGIAPFRAFMQQRYADGATGDNWLLFGNPHFLSDFLYQTEWQRYAKDGLLKRVDLAWSRDQNDKIYVQHKLEQQSALVWQWLEQGAHIYVCGDAGGMAKAVEETIVNIIRHRGDLTPELAQDYLNELRANKRYQRDVY